MSTHAMEADAFVRFRDASNQIHYGNLSKQDISSKIIGTTVEILDEDPLEEFRNPTTGEKAVVNMVRKDLNLIHLASFRKFIIVVSEKL